MKSEVLDGLRAKAERVLLDRCTLDKQDSPGELNRIFDDLQVYQVELEMQNEELLSTSLEVQKQKDRFSNLFESAPVGYIVLNTEGLISNVNRTALRLFNKDESRMVGKPFAAFVSPVDISNFYLFLRSVVNKGVEQHCELQFISSGTAVLFRGLLQGVPIESANSQKEIYITLTDIIEKQRAQRKLSRAKHRLNLALEASETGICELHPDTGLFYLDSYCCYLFGLDTQRFEGTFEKLITRIHPEDREHLQRSLTIAVIREQTLNIEFRIVVDYEIKYIQARGRIISEEGEQKTFLATFTDISEKKLWELETQRLKEEQDKATLAAALQAEENEKKRMSETLHDGVAQMLYATKLNLDHLRSQAGNDSLDQAIKLIDLAINDVRNLSFELTPAVLLDFGLKATIDEMIQRLESESLYFSTSVNIDRNVPHSLQLNIYRITQELVNNCIKHAYCDKIYIEIAQKPDTIHLLVKDNGIGMKSEQVRKKAGGTGLSSIRNRIRLYDGRMSIKAGNPSGTQVAITLRYKQ